MRAINHKERIKHIKKAVVYSLLSLLLLPICILTNQFVKGPINPIINGLEQEIFKMVDQQKHINLLFVFDATEGMKSYINEIGYILHVNLHEAFESNENLSFSVAATVYRDKKEGAFSFEYSLKEVDSTANTAERVGVWLTDREESNTYNEDETEPVFYGLEKSLSRSPFKEGEMNILIHVGAAGTSSSDLLEAEELVTLFKEKK